MQRLERDAILIALMERLRARGSWCGETHIQKAVYILQEMAGVPMDFTYILYKHGPFSFDLRDELTAMRGDQLVEIEPRPYPYGPSLAPSPLGIKVRERYAEIVQQYERQIEFVTACVSEKGVTDLEQLATALYVTLKSPQASRESRAMELHALKPHISIEDANSAVAQIDDLSRCWRISH